MDCGLARLNRQSTEVSARADAKLDVQRALFSLYLYLLLSLSLLLPPFFFIPSSRRVALRIAPRITSRAYVLMVFVSYIEATQTLGGDNLPRPRPAVDSDIME